MSAKRALPAAPAVLPATHGVKRDKRDADHDFSWSFDAAARVYVGLYRGGGQPGAEIAAFDFDGTLSVPKSGKTFPVDGSDYSLLDPRLVARVREVTRNRRFVIFTNQAGVDKHTTSAAVREPVFGLPQLLGPEPCIIFASVDQNSYRKPRTGMFDLFCQEYNGGVKVDAHRSVYVGDAAGRPKTSTAKKDHSNADFLFAINCGFNFLTPEQLLAGTEVEVAHQANMASLPRPPDPRKWLSEAAAFAQDHGTGSRFPDEQSFKTVWTQVSSLPRVVVVMVGLPGSGKSTFVQRFCPDWQVVSCDKTGSMKKCETLLSEYLGQSSCRVVVDNTNFDLKSRSRWLEIVNQAKCALLAVWLDVGVDQAIHNVTFRRLAALRSGDLSAQMVPTFVIRNQSKSFQAPSLQEGFASVFRIFFKPSFRDESLHSLYIQHL